MTLCLLHGPSTLTVEDTPVYLGRPFGFLSRIGFFAEAYRSSDDIRLGTCVFDLDGVGYVRGTGGYVHQWDYGYDLRNGELVWNAYYPLAGCYIGVKFDHLLLRPRSPYLINTGPLWETYNAAAIDGGYLRPTIQYSNRLRVSRYNAAYVFQAHAREITLPSNAKTAWITPAHVAERFFAIAAMNNGSVRIYPILLRDYSLAADEYVINPARYSIPCLAPVERVAYSPQFDVFLVVHPKDATTREQTLSIWAREAMPAALSNPEALSAVNAGYVVPLRCRLTGEDSDPVEGLVVDWQITSGPGTLVNGQGVTGEDGYSKNWLLVPPDAGADITVGVSTVAS